MTQTGLPDTNGTLETILAIDPGTTQSAYVVYNPSDKTLLEYGLVPNAEMLAVIAKSRQRRLAVEHIAAMGMAVGKTVFETCVWVGRFIQIWIDRNYAESKYRAVYRRDEKIHLCNSMKAKDGNIRQSIMDRYGSERQIAIGTQKKPGPLYGVHDDIWAAMAVAITAAETAAEWRTA